MCLCAMTPRRFNRYHVPVRRDSQALWQLLEPVSRDNCLNRYHVTVVWTGINTQALWQLLEPVSRASCLNRYHVPVAWTGITCQCAVTLSRCDSCLNGYHVPVRHDAQALWQSKVSLRCRLLSQYEGTASSLCCWRQSFLHCRRDAVVCSFLPCAPWPTYRKRT